MKHRLIKPLLVILVLMAFSACTSAPAEPIEPEFRATYPSQFIVGDTYILKDREQIKGNIVGIGTTLIIGDGAIVMGDVSLIGSSLDLSGRIAGDLNVMAGTSFIKDTAIIAGNVNQIFQKIDIAPKALVTGEINTYSFPETSSGNIGSQIIALFEWLHPGRIVGLQVAKIVGLVLASLIGIFLLRLPTSKISGAIQTNAPAAWGAGLLSIITGPIIAIILIVTICLSPVGILLLLALGISNLWGWIALSVILGVKIVDWLKLDWNIELATIIGALFLGIFSTLVSFIPCIGFLINLMISATGIGGVLLSNFGISRK